MIGLVLTTGLVAIAVVALFGSALGRHLIGAAPAASRRSATPTQQPAPPVPPNVDRDDDHLVDAEEATGDEPAPGAEVEPLRHRPALSLKARLAFVYSTEPGSVVLDCTLAEFEDDPADVVPAGTPFTLQLRLPETAWFATSLELLLEQWAAECRIVEIALLARDGHAKAHVGDGSSRLMLEVDSAAGLSVG